jgi:hypothetical protein
MARWRNSTAKSGFEVKYVWCGYKELEDNGTVAQVYC